MEYPIPPARKNEVHLSTIVLVTVGIFDLVTTLVWLNQGNQEGNPLFAWLAGHGSVVFALGKLAFLILPILALEYARKSNPKSAEQGTWLAACFYVFFYVAHLFKMW